MRRTTEGPVVPDGLPASLDADVPARRRRRILRLSTLPAALTLGNLVCGVLAISYVADATALSASGDAAGASALLARAGWLILLGMVFDGFDGSVARMVRSTSHFGSALDSLADVVSFGVAPALVAKALMDGALGIDRPRMTFLTAAFFAVCACLRLARYNAEHDAQEPHEADEPEAGVTSFSGLPTPGAAGVVAGAALVHRQVLEWWDLDVAWKLGFAYALGFGVLAGLGLLMVSRVPYVHFANRFLHGRKSVGGVALLFFALMLVLNFDTTLVLAVTFAAYAASGPLLVLPRLFRGRPAELPELFD